MWGLLGRVQWVERAKASECDLLPGLPAASGWSCPGEFCLRSQPCLLPSCLWPASPSPLLVSPGVLSLYISCTGILIVVSAVSVTFPILQMRKLRHKTFQPLPRVSHSQGWLSWALDQLWSDSFFHTATCGKGQSRKRDPFSREIAGGRGSKLS